MKTKMITSLSVITLLLLFSMAGCSSSDTTNAPKKEKECSETSSCKDGYACVDGKCTSLSTKIPFEDKNLEGAVIKALKEQDSSFNDKKGYVTVGECQGLTKLDAWNKGITSIKGIEYCTGLEQLYLSVNQISDISPLSGLTNLTELDLHWNQITDISPLSRLTNLTTLYLYNNQISDISPLSGLTNLTVLYLNHNQISDISPLSRLTNLTELWLNKNQITDISPLSGLTKLTELYLDGNQISDISALLKNDGLGEGDQVWLIGNPIVDKDPKGQIQALKDKGVTVYTELQAP